MSHSRRCHPLVLLLSATAQACASSDPHLVRTLQMPRYTRSPGTQCSVAFSPDGKLVVGACGVAPVPVWEAESGKLAYTLYDDSVAHIVSCDFSPDGAVLACGGFDQKVSMFAAASGDPLGVVGQHTSPVWEVTFSPDGQWLVSSGFQDDVRAWSAAGEALWSYTPGGGVLSVAVDPGGTRVAYGGLDGVVGVLDAATGRGTSMLLASGRCVGDLAFAPAGDVLVAGRDDGQVYRWEVEGFTALAPLVTSHGYVNGVAVATGGELLAGGYHDGKVRLWDTRTGELVATLEGHQDPVLRVAFDRTGTRLASISWDGTVKLWRPAR